MSRKYFDDLSYPNGSEAPQGRLSMALDVSEYAGELEGISLTEAQERELLETLWSIMGSFVQLGFEVDILQLFVPDKDSDAVESKDTTTIKTTFNANGKERAT